MTIRYETAISWIIERSGYDRGFIANPFLGDDVAALGLRRTAEMLRRLGDPQAGIKLIHVAGTKGKGSTAATIATIARSAGVSTGVYATPHLHTFRERILIDDEPLSELEFAAIVEILQPIDRALQVDEPDIGEPTAFEVATAMALLAFARAGVDLAVVEVGMGGRLDATNVVTPNVAAITSISLDHMAILGDSLAEIAAEKGGIIKPGCPVVVGPQAPEALAVLERIATERESPIYPAGRDWHVDGERLSGPWGDWHDVRLALRGSHQMENTGIALMALWLLDPRLLADEQRARAALASVSWPGRFERVASDPTIIVDGAHNVDSIARLAQTVAEARYGRLTVILGISRDKDVEGMVAALAALSPSIIATASHNPRAADPDRLAAAAHTNGLPVEVVVDVATAVHLARSRSQSDDLILVTGSLYAVAEAREALGLAETPVFERRLLYG